MAVEIETCATRRGRGMLERPRWSDRMPGRRRELTFRFLAEPGDVNYGGKVFGGAVMKWIDQAAYALAVGWSGRYAVTVHVGGLEFERPIAIGHLVEVRARLMRTGRTSMHIGVEVKAADPRRGEAPGRTTHCIVVFVALDEAGRPTEVPPFEPRTDEERALEAHARHVAELRAALDAERAAFLARLEPAARLESEL
jgi:acyl-CoA hydrolase